MHAVFLYFHSQISTSTIMLSTIYIVVLELLVIVCLLSSKYRLKSLSNLTPPVCNADFLLEILSLKPDDITMTSSGLFFQN